MSIYKEARLDNNEIKCYELACNGHTYSSLKKLKPEVRRYRLMLRDNRGFLIDPAKYNDDQKGKSVALSKFDEYVASARAKLASLGHKMADSSGRAFIVGHYKCWTILDGEQILYNEGYKKWFYKNSAILKD